MSQPMTIESQGEHEYLIHLSGQGETVESWFRVTPGILGQLHLADLDEASVVRRTVEFLLRHQDVPDFPPIVELEDVVASYDDFVKSLSI